MTDYAIIELIFIGSLVFGAFIAAYVARDIVVAPSYHAAHEIERQQAWAMRKMAEAKPGEYVPCDAELIRSLHTPTEASELAKAAKLGIPTYDAAKASQRR